MARIRKAGVTVLGWVLVLVGVVVIPLPGPGWLLLLSGLVVLSGEYTWAERWVEPVRAKAIAAARFGVATWPRIVLSALSACLVIATGIFWWVNPPIPEIGPIGPALPLGGWPTGSGIIFSGVVALGLLIYSVVKFRSEAAAERQSASVS